MMSQTREEQTRQERARNLLSLSDADLLRRVVALAASAREATVELVSHLAELDARRLYLGEGYGSLFSYCTGALRLSEHAAYNRIEAARTSREFPAILDLLADGSLNLSTLRLIAPHLRRDTFEAVVSAARGRSKREVEMLVAHLAPRADAPSSVRKLPTPPNRVDAARAAPTAPAVSPAGEARGFVSERPSVRPVCDPPFVAPLAPGRYRVQFTVGEEAREKLRRVQELLRRDIPDGNPGAIFERALGLLLQDVARRKLADASRPRACGAAATASRRVPASVKRAVWIRDAGRCAFVASSGRRCAERAFLEFHHRKPYALGGEATVGNIALRCRRHNAYEAELELGPRAFSAARQTRAESSDGPQANSPRGELDSRRASCARQAPSTAHADSWLAATCNPDRL